MKKFNKKGTHVGVILSLVIFVSFLIFLYIVIEPALRTPEGKQSLIDSLKLRLPEEFSADLTTVTISATPDSADCLQIDNTVLGVSELNASVKDGGGALVDFENTGNYLIIDWTGNQDFFKIYYSEEEFKDYSSSFTCSNTEIIIVSSLKTEKKIFETKIVSFISLYESNYGEIKEVLKIPSGDEFSFSFTYSNGTVISPIEENPSVNIYAENINIQYIDKEANINSGILTIRVW